MKLKSSRFGVITVILLLACCCPASTYAQSAVADLGTNYEILALATGLSRSFTFKLNDVIWNDYSAFQATFITTVGAGTLSFSIASASALGENADILYATTGFIGTQPVIGLAYGSGSINKSVEVPEVGIGVLLTAIVAGISGPDFPVTMSMNASLSAK